MELTFNDSGKITVQSYVVLGGQLKIRMIHTDRDAILNDFRDVSKTIAMKIKNDSGDISTFERYTTFTSLTEYTGGVWEVCMTKEGASMQELISGLSDQIQLLSDCVLELSEMVYE